MTMIGGSLPLIVVVYITMLLELFISLVFSLVFSVIDSKIWYLLLPAPILEVIVTLIVFYDAFVRVNRLYLWLKVLLALVYFIQ